MPNFSERSNTNVEFGRITLPRTQVNKGKKGDRGRLWPRSLPRHRCPRPAGRLLYEEATVLGAENSEVSCGEPAVALVAVAVMACPTETALEGVKVKAALPSAPVVTLFVPMNFLPSSPEGLE